MIISRIAEGLGNQLFQYAAGRSLSLRHGVPLALDISKYGRTGKRPFELAQFNIPALETDLDPYVTTHFNLYQEPHFHFDPCFSQVEVPVYLAGFWQSDLYFKEYRAELMQELAVRESLVTHLLPLVAEIGAGNSVAVHIRRGDYLRPVFLKRHGVLPVTYYHTAIGLLAEQAEPLQLYFFSDDMPWVQQQLHTSHTHTFVSGQFTHNALEDFYLMSRCKHHIIANSSFSWWAAWLSNHPQKKVLAPAQWFQEFPADTKDLIPSTWTRL